jgi:endogenous inhibitor of DNA gyrase (YacG/DUF329 family)
MKKIHCPICGKKNTWNSQNKFKPFCSHRCKLIDLGEWANDSRKIAGNEPVNNEESPEPFPDSE